MGEPRPDGTDAHTWRTAVEYHLGDRFDDEITRALTRAVARIGPGGRLPAERDLAEEIGVSRNALRDRIRLLESAGILARRQGSGTYVERVARSDGLSASLDLLVTTEQLQLSELHEARVALELRAALLAANRTDIDGAALTAMQEAVDGMALDFGSPLVAQHDLAFHRALFQASGNGALQFFAEALNAVFMRAIYLGTHNWQVRGTGRNLLVAVHQDILDAVTARDGEAAARAVESHFRVHDEVIRG